MTISLFKNYLLDSAAAGWGTAQIVKAFLHLITNKKFKLERLIGSGGMPSSHSAAVSALATTAWAQYGITSYEFGITAVLACIVMYDACGIRRAVGEHAKLLNEFHHTLADGKPADEKFKELIGHTPLQVLVGAIIGIFAAVILLSIA